MWPKILNFFKNLYVQLVGINDSSFRIALGVGVGVFTGILPGLGPVASLAVAYVFRINKAAALLGCLLTNTWLSIVSFVLALKIGSALLGVRFTDIDQQAHHVMEHFSWKALLDVSMLNVLKPLLIGYAVVALLSAAIAFILTYVILEKRRLDKVS